MPKFAVFFSVDPAALARFIENPEDRRASLARVIEAAGGASWITTGCSASLTE